MKTAPLLLLLSLSGFLGRTAGLEETVGIEIPYLQTDNALIDRAYRIAIGDLLSNVRPHQGGILEQATPVILAGLDYGRPWTRDASVNAWNGASMIMPDIARDTLLSVLLQGEGNLRIGGQYWDAMVWTSGAWNHYLVTGDREFLALALEATTNSLLFFEQTEFDPDRVLFRGPGWSDGVAAYPGVYGDSGGSSAILDWPKHHPDKISKPGYGIPILALSSNCLYYNAYRVAEKMAAELGRSADPGWSRKAARLKESINQQFWMPKKGRYRFFVGPYGNCDDQEGLGHAYALLFGLANDAQAGAIFANLHVTAAGLPCGWPTCPRYRSENDLTFGRHSGPVWPQIQGFWAEAAARAGRSEMFAHELFKLAEHAVRDNQFAEIYHPITGEIYGGMQESGGQGIILWKATSRQTWAATAFLRMVYLGLAGMRFEPDGVRFAPCLPEGLARLGLSNLHYRGMTLEVTIQGQGQEVERMIVNGKPASLIPATETGTVEVMVRVGE